MDDSESRDLYARILEARPLIGMVQCLHNVAMLSGLLRRHPAMQHRIMQWFNLSEKHTGSAALNLVLEHTLRISNLEEAFSGTTDERGSDVEDKALKNFKRQQLPHMRSLGAIDTCNRRLSRRGK